MVCGGVGEKSCCAIEQSSSLLKGWLRDGCSSTCVGHWTSMPCCFLPMGYCRSEVAKPVVLLHSKFYRPVCNSTITKRSLIC